MLLKDFLTVFVVILIPDGEATLAAVLNDRAITFVRKLSSSVYFLIDCCFNAVILSA